MTTVTLDAPGDLDAAAVLAVADGARIELTPALLRRVRGWRDETLAALATAGPVYGVSTGLGLAAHLAVGTADQPGLQDDLMLARSVGGPPWLGPREVRAVLATRLRTLLAPEVGASADLVVALVAVLDSGVLPALPATGNGAAGEIIPLAHLGAFLTGAGDALDETGSATPSATPSGAALEAAGLAAYAFGAKEGVAFLQGVPVGTALSLLLAHELRVLASQSLTVAAGEIALVRAPRDPYDGRLARGDDDLHAVLGALRRLAGPEESPRMLQAPVSFRVVGPATVHLLRTVRHLEESVERSLCGVTTSPALLDGRFVGTTGFDGFDLAASADACRLAVLHVAEVATARLHRMLDPRVTGLAAQLSPRPGRAAGVVGLHKRAVAVVHEARRTSAPASLGALETSLGQEDVQSFGLESAGALQHAGDALRDVIACELVALHQASLLDHDTGAGARGSESLRMVLHKASEDLPDTSEDRLLGREVSSMRHALGLGWAHASLSDVLDDARDPAPPPL